MGGKLTFQLGRTSTASGLVGPTDTSVAAIQHGFAGVFTAIHTSAQSGTALQTNHMLVESNYMLHSNNGD